MNLKASSIMRYKTSNIEIEEKEFYYNASIPQSLELIELIRKLGLMVDTNKTDAIVNVTFDKGFYTYYDKEKENYQYKLRKNQNGTYYAVKQNRRYSKPTMNKQKLREVLYRDGFIIDGKEYAEYKRSTNKAKQGSHLFILKELQEYMQSWSRLGITIPDDAECDLTSIKAYESLVMSSIIGTVDIKKDEILIVDDIKNHPFRTKAYKVIINKKNHLDAVKDDNYEVTNDCLDGESLMDSSLFDGEGMKLLRTQLMKSCAFNTEIQKFVKEHEIKTVTDMFGNVLDATKIKLILTPNSLKIFKFGKYIKGNSMKTTYEYWLNNISSTFGVVKSEHPSRYGNGNYNVLSYQMINSLPFTEEDIIELMLKDKEYLTLLKKDFEVFKLHTGCNVLNENKDFVQTMICLDKNFAQTDLFKKYRSDVYEDYMNKLKQGKVHVKGDYYTLCSMPYEFLLHAFSIPWEKPLLNPHEIYNCGLEDNKEITMFRNPHIGYFNVEVGKNVVHKEFKKWFNLTKNIVVICPWESDIMEKLNSADFDSDTVLGVDSDVILKRAKEFGDYYVPHKCIDDSMTKKTTRYYSAKSLAELDSTLSDNRIGEIVNLSATLQSFIWNEKTKEVVDYKYIELLEKQIMILAVASCIEIDKAKHECPFDMKDELDLIRSIEYKGELICPREVITVKYKPKAEEIEKLYNAQQKKDKELQKQIKNEWKNKAEWEIKEDVENKECTKEKMVRPYFLKFNKNNQGGEYAWDATIKTPMNYLINYIEHLGIRADPSTELEFSTYFNTKKIDINKGDRKQRQDLTETCLSYCKERKNYFKNKKDVDLNSIREEHLDKIRNKQYKVNKKKIEYKTETILGFIYQIYYRKKGEKERKYENLYKNRLTIFKLLYDALGEELINCLSIVKNDEVTYLKLDENGEIDIWGEKFCKITKIIARN